MSEDREIIAVTFNMKAGDVCCRNCSAHKGEGLFLDCKFWGSTTKFFEYCNMFLPEGTE